ncbi:MAG: GxxExxY protein [Candidatus Muirbacterium halophilum]|nr:GxxExxY protein [Candidatus Muirbacterium halophilum]MCK9476387.1 GxxExxY protein [Candidatus Muirbacterium halophilum]
MPLIFEEETYKIRSVIFEVYNELGSGFLENVYHECMKIELLKNGIPFDSEKELNVYYKGSKLNQIYKADFICFDKIIIEIKAVKKLSLQHESQILNYLKCTKMKLGLLVNFGSFSTPEIKRIAN